MSWIQKLYETYENCLSEVGKVSEDENRVPLLPISHTTQKAQVEVVLDGEGRFKRANVVPKNLSRTIIPCTESSCGRTGTKPPPHPLCDKIQYVYPNFHKIGGTKFSGYDQYLFLLHEWCSSPFSDPKIEAIYKYVKSGTLFDDLIESRVLIIGTDGRLMSEWKKSNNVLTPKIFEVTKSQLDIFIRWVVEIPGEVQSAVWTDSALWEKWIQFYKASKTKTDISYISGKSCYIGEKHPAKIRNDADSAKLISADDTSGFTYRGRFVESGEVAVVGYEESQKAHSALRWLISKQGYQKDDLSVVAWATTGKDVPQFMSDPIGLLGFDDLKKGSNQQLSTTAEETAHKLNKLIAGYSQTLDDKTPVIVMAVDSATPGRLSVIYYQQLTGSDFLHRLQYWQDTCAWKHSYKFVTITDEKTGKSSRRIIQFIGAPAPDDIAEAAYGTRLDEKLRKATLKRILLCIIEARPIPRDLVESVVRRSVNRISMKPEEWEKNLSIACSLFRKNSFGRENYDMSLELERKTRDYLYGRLLALAESLEQWALNKAGEDRGTNAARLMQRFADHPYTTWRTIELALGPSKARLGGKSTKLQRMIDEVIASFKEEDFLSDRKLSGEFLLGYHCQREALRTSNDSTPENEPENK
jgi:CRISPR-associated protein Csd1